MGKNVILVDYDVDDSWEFLSAVEKETEEPWELRKSVTNRLHGRKSKELIRYIKYFLFSFLVFLQRKKYSKIIAWQQFYGLLFAFYCAVFHVKKNCALFVMTFIYRPKRSALYNKMIRFIVRSGYITKIIVLSDSEVDYYSSLFNVSRDLFFNTRIGIPDQVDRFVPSNQTEKYYLSVGRSNRDYAFLCSAWKKEFGKLIIVCDSYKETPKEGIVCLRECYGDDYMKLVSECYAEIIVLLDEKISSGSLSFLQAMMMRKPTIVTENETVHDYIVDGENGLIIPKDADALAAALLRLEKQEEYKRISTQARKDYESKYSESALGKHVGQMIVKDKSKHA